MIGNWLYSHTNMLSKRVRISLQHHFNIALRSFLLGENLLILLMFWYIWQAMPHPQAFSLWLAGYSVTLGLLSACALGSTLLSGYRPYHDPWVRLATTLFFVLSFALLLSTQFG